MKISVIFINGSIGSINSDDLDELLEKKVVLGFRRSSGWVMAGMDALRSSRDKENGSWRDRKSTKQLMKV